MPALPASSPGTGNLVRPQEPQRFLRLFFASRERVKPLVEVIV